MQKVIVHWVNRFGEVRAHTLFDATESYARNWWRENILECQGVLSKDEARGSKLELLRIENPVKPYRFRIDSESDRSLIKPQTFCHTWEQVERIKKEHQEELPRCVTTVTEI